jgi:hypothetical protein
MSYLIIYNESIWYEGVSHEDCKQAMLSVPDDVDMEIIHSVLWDFENKKYKPVTHWQGELPVEGIASFLIDKLWLIDLPGAGLLITPGTYVLEDDDGVTIVELVTGQGLLDETELLHGDRVREIIKRRGGGDD